MIKKLFIPFLILGIFMLGIIFGLASCGSIFKTIPLIEDSDMEIYVTTVNEVSANKVLVDWRQIVAIDAVRYSQDFSKATKQSIIDLTNKFIKENREEVQEQDPVTHQTVTKTKITYTLVPLSTVLSELGFDSEQVEDVDNYMTIGLLDEGGGGTGNWKNPSGAEFVKEVANGAIESYSKYHIFPSITIAQAILESTWGKDAPGNNLFGIKAYGGWTGPYQYLSTSEYIGGIPVKVMDKFRIYSSVQDCLLDHAKFLNDNSIYRNSGVLSATNYIEQAYALQKAGYATDPAYAVKLIDIINQNNFEQYDK